jgi:GntR family transcriptional repressor for pyruvate dehydrogenase complex
MRQSQRPRRISVGRVKATKSSEALADVLREQILTGGFDEGTSLPSERDIVDETGLGRGSVREALRVLEVEGLIRTKTGRHGGAYTTRPDESGLMRFVSLFVRGRSVPMGALLEARTMLEPSLAYLAALNRTPEDETALNDACAAMEAATEGVAFGRLNLAWHYCVAAASHNELLVAFLNSIESAIAQGSEAHAKVFEADFTDIRRAVVRAHRRVTEAVVRGQADAAKRRMERHLHAYAETLANAESLDVDTDVA